MVLDATTGRPVALPAEVQALPPPRPRVLADELIRFPAMPVPELEVEFPVRLSDLDINRHVNNVHYVEWIVESVPPTVWNEQTATELDITFRAPAVHGDVVVVRTARVPDSAEPAFLHRLVEAKSGRELVRARTLWRQL